MKIFKSTFTLIGFLFILFTTSAQDNGFEVLKSLEHIDQVYENLDKYFVDEVPVGNLSKVAIDAMLKELDPYTVYYHESNIEDYQLMTTGQYGGIGAVIRKVDEYVVVAEPYEESPAAKSGLLAGDKILQIEGRDMKNKSTSEVSQSLKGPKGTTIEVLIKRQGQKKTISITRDEIKMPDVPYYAILKDNTGYIKLNSFTQTASQEVKKAFTELKSQGMTSLIFDLRGNGGGLLIESVKIVNMFVPKHETVVTTQGRIAGEDRTYKTLEEPLDTEMPLVVLVDGGSASASEIVSGSLQDLDRAVIIGSQSYGKGLVQRTYDLSYGAKMKLTIAKYYTPSGRCVQRLEYYDKMDEDEVSEIPDSLVTKFYTKNGREVIDGRGVTPDVKVDQKDLSALAITMLGNSIYYKFANQFYYNNPAIESPDNFEVTDAIYTQFKQFVLAQEFEYNTASKLALENMKKIAQEEGYFEAIQVQYESMLKEVSPSKERDLDLFQEQIRQLLGNEIISRYFYQRGRSILALKSDPAIENSISVLNSIKEYNTILKK